MLRIFKFAIVVLAALVVSAAPLGDPPLEDLQARAPDPLRVSLRETGTGTANWHFALVVRGAAALGAAGEELTAHELVVDTANACMSYDTREAFTTPAHIKATANIIPARERNTKDLKAKLATIFRGVSAANAGNMPVTATGGFMNCFDWAVVAVETLQSRGYVSAAEAATFRAYHTQHAAAVRAATEAGTIALCNLTTRALGGKPSKACAMKPAGGKKASPGAKPQLKAQNKAGSRQSGSTPKPKAGTRPPPGGRKLKKRSPLRSRW